VKSPGRPEPPRAAIRPKVLEAHGDRRVDPYYWLREKGSPDVLAYLEAENEYADAVLAAAAELREKVYREIVGRIQETDTSAPIFFKGWVNYTRSVEGLEYEIYCRRPGSMYAPEQAYLDGNALAAGHAYFDLGYVERSPNQNIVAYAVDTNGSELHELRFRDLVSGADLDDAISGVHYGAAWSADSRTFFYVKPDAAMRPYQVWRHRLGTDVGGDVLVWQEDDERFELGVELTKSERFILLSSSGQITSECRFLPSAEPEAEPKLIEPRRDGIEYSVDHQGERFLILTNDGARSFRLVAAPITNPGREAWSEVVPERPGVRLNFTDVHAGHIVLGQRSDGMERLEVLDTSTGEMHVVEQPDPAYTAFPGSSPNYESSVMRFYYTSLTAPFSAVDYDMRTRERTLVKEQPVRGGYQRADYVTERLWATSEVGVRVPMSIVYRKGLQQDGSNPAMLYGYGAYEASIDPMFDPARLSLLDRGFVYAIAHVRGGGELGREWYESGKFLSKRNTFSDFLACAHHLIDCGYTNPSRLAARGRSAGGLLIGAVVNEEPELFACAVAQVPFVDALTTMLDAKLPLTVNEYAEWGDPSDAQYYRYMKSYSPYDNVHEASYPALLVTGAVNDPRVSYFEPAKWVAKLRSVDQGGRPLLLKTQMDAGHMGPSGRYESWREEALVLAFVISELGAD